MKLAEIAFGVVVFAGAALFISLGSSVIAMALTSPGGLLVFFIGAGVVALMK